MAERRTRSRSRSPRYWIDTQAWEAIDKKWDKAEKEAKAELRYALINLRQKLTDKNIDKMVREANLDYDGKVNLEEFVKRLMAK